MRLSRKRLAQHWHYSRLWYLLAVAGAVAAAAILLSVTKPQTPITKKVDIFIVSGAMDATVTDSWGREILGVLSPDQKEANVMGSPIIQGQEDTIMQMIMARLSAREATVWILPRKPETSDYFDAAMNMGAFKPLDDILSQLDIPKGTDLSPGRAAVTTDDGKPGVSHQYGIPLEGCAGLTNGIDTTGMMLAIPVYGVNDANAIAAINWLLNKTKATAPVDTTLKNNQKVSISILAQSFRVKTAEAWRKGIQSVLPAGQLETDITLARYVPGREDFMAGAAETSIKAGQGAMWVVPQDIFSKLAKAGVLLPLDSDLGSFKIPEGTDLSSGRAAAVVNGKPGAEQQYGIPMDKCQALAQVTDPKGMLMVFPNWQRKDIIASIFPGWTKLDFNYANAKLAANWLLTTNELPEAADTAK